MLALRDAHEKGPTRVAIDGAHVLTGGHDGVVALFPRKRWPQSRSLWARQCHAAAVTCVVLHDGLGLAFSCGRDGHIVLHESIHSPAAVETETTDATAVAATSSTSRVVCRVTGEVRSMVFDPTAKRLFLCGDSLRYLAMSGRRWDAHTVPTVVPHPFAAVALAPCGRLLAMASTNGSIGVVSVDSPTTTTTANSDTADIRESTVVPPPTTTTAPAAVPPPVRIVMERVLSPTIGRDDCVAYRLRWCRTAAGLLLFAPAATETTVMRFEPADAANGMTAARLRVVGGLRGEGLVDIFSVAAYAVTAHRICCVMASRGGLFIGKLDDKKLIMARHTGQLYPEGDQHDGGSVTDVGVCEATGDVVVGLASGKVSLLQRASLRGFDEAKEAAKKAKRVEESNKKKARPGPADVIGAATGELQYSFANANEEEEEDKEKGSREDAGGKRRRNKKNNRAGGARHADDGFINDGACDEEGDDGSKSNYSSSASTTDSSSSNSDSESDLDVEGNVKMRGENLEKVVTDLKANNAEYIEANGTERPSRWRHDDPLRVLADAERSVRRGGRNDAVASRFLDDEAEEASSQDLESEDAAANEEDGFGNRSRRNNNANPDNDHADDLDEEDEQEEMGDYVDGSIAAADGDHHHRANATAAAQLDYSFQVGATPAGEEESCYLAYNATGYIHCTREGTTVHFHDVANPAVRINERGTIVMGALSPVGAGFIVAPQSQDDGNFNSSHNTAAAFVGDSIDDDVPRLTVYYRTFVALGAQSDWRARLQPGETVRCMTAGIRYLAVATSHYLRLYSLSGLELAVLSKFPRVVAMAGTSSRRLMSSFKADFDPLAVVFLEGGAHRVEVLDVGSRSTAVPAVSLPLTELPDGSAHQLQWVGWSTDGPLHVADTAGVVRMFTTGWGGAWVPVYDPRSAAATSASEQASSLWIWGVSDERLFAYRSAATVAAPYPAAIASGLPVDRVPLFIPLSRTVTAMGDRETPGWDHLLRREVRTDELKRHSAHYSASLAKHDAVHDAKIKEMFTGALKAQLTSRAVDLATMLELRDNIEDCAREANAGGHGQLVQKLLALYDLRVRAKAKRKCELPLEKAMVSERERDELLRKLLVRERGGGRNTNKSVNSNIVSDGNNATEGRTQQQQQQLAEVVEDDDDAPAVSSAASSSGRPSPAKSEASTAITATTAAAVAPSTFTAAAQRRVTFNVPDGNAAVVSNNTPHHQPTHQSPAKGPGVSSASSAASSSSFSSVQPTKATNPFAARKAAAIHPTPTAAATVAAAAVPAAREKTQATLSVPTRTTFTTAKAPTVVDLIGGDSQSESQTATVTATPTPPRADDDDPHYHQPQQQQHHADSLSPSGGRPTGTTPVSGPRSSPGTTAPAAAAADPPPPPKPRGSLFVPKALAASAPVDPFLTDDETATAAATAVIHGSSNTTNSYVYANSSLDSQLEETGPVVSVQALLDAGHEESLPSAPRSTGFGEALRKRYRDDDEDDDDDDDRNGMVVPRTSFARI